MKYKQGKPLRGDNKSLGKIESVKFGFCGYQDAMFGLQVTLSFSHGNMGSGDSITGGWAYGVVDPDEHSKWTEEERTQSMADMCKVVCQIMNDAQVADVNDLVGKPVEVTTKDFNEFESWRILTEVL